MRTVHFGFVVVFLTAICLSSVVAWAPAPATCSSPLSGSGGFNCSSEKPSAMPPVHTAAPVFVRSVPNGKRYLGGTGNDTFHIVHLYSANDSLYEMGYALGQLFPNEIADMFTRIEPWLERLLEQSLPWLPSWLADIVIEDGAPVALDLLYDLTEKYIPADYLEEWQGIADGANCSIEDIKRVSLFPQASKAACTLFLSESNATVDGGCFHLRALDFDPTSYVADFSSLIIYHYKNKPQFANFGWVAMTGCLTCMNDVPISSSEKKWGGHSTELPFGLPWMQMMRKALEFDNMDAINAYVAAVDMANATTPQTVSIHVGYADQKEKSIIGWEIGYNYSKSFEWNTQTPTPTLPNWPGIVLFPKNSNPVTTCVKEMVDAQYGQIDANWMANYYSPNDMTGDTQVVGFDLQGMKVYYANSRKSWAPNSGPICAYYRQRTLVDMASLFNETQ